MSDPVKIPATLDKLTTLKDRSIKLTFETQEIGPEQSARLIGMIDQVGWLIFAPPQAGHVVIPDEPPPEFKLDKSPSQRLRSVLFVLWKQRGEKGEFDDFYKANMNKFIEWVKDKLEGDG